MSPIRCNPVLNNILNLKWSNAIRNHSYTLILQDPETGTFCADQQMH